MVKDKVSPYVKIAASSSAALVAAAAAAAASTASTRDLTTASTASLSPALAAAAASTTPLLFWSLRSFTDDDSQSKNEAFACSLITFPSHIYGINIIMLLGIIALLSLLSSANCALNFCNVVLSINTSFFLILTSDATTILDFKLSTIIGSVIFLLIEKNKLGSLLNIISNDLFDLLIVDKIVYISSITSVGGIFEIHS